MTDALVVNIVGALALAVASDVERATEQSSELSRSDAAAMMVIAQQPGLSIDRLRQILKLSHSGCVRLVDRLVQSGLVSREAGPDGRTVSLKAVRLGLDKAAHISNSRLSLLRAKLGSLSADELDQLGKIASKLLAESASTAIEAQRVCRLCDQAICFRRGQCPVATGLKRYTERQSQ
jgi:DNA-binding MarR family transcriptional regulator